MKASVTSNEFEKELVSILRFWSDHMVDTDHGGFYDVHIRDESSYNIGLIEAIKETLEIAEKANIPANISHIKATLEFLVVGFLNTQRLKTLSRWIFLISKPP